MKGLTKRERQVMQLVSAGETNKMVAAQLHITEQTVKNHCTNVYRKLRARNRTQAVSILGKESGNEICKVRRLWKRGLLWLDGVRRKVVVR